MSGIKWTNSFAVGIETLDNHHKKLFDIINELHEAMMTGKSQNKMKELITKLKEYTLFHFNEEEKVLAKAGYEELKDQKQAHKEFIEKILSIEKKIIDDQRAPVSIETSIYLNRWLQDHIKGKDKKYADTISNKDI